MNAVVVPSVLSSWARTVVDALIAHGVDPGPVLAEAGFSEESFRDPNSRQPLKATVLLWHKAAERVGDPAFGLKVPRYTRQTTFHALGYSVLASVTVGEALERAVRFCHVVVDAGLLELTVQGKEAQLRIAPQAGYERGGHEFRDALLSMLVRILRSLTRGAFELSGVYLRRPTTSDLAPYRAFFGCSVRLGEADVLSFDSAQLQLPLKTGNAELASFSDTAVRDYLGRMATGTVTDRVRAAIAALLPNQVSPEAVAKRVGLSLRSMQRNLREHGTSYEEVLRAMRRDMAETHLRAGRYALAEVAFLLGYKSVTAFSRAFKRWTGQAPADFISANMTQRAKS